MSDYIVEMRNVTKRFPGIVANDDVTVQIKKGEIYALLGENGAGKSTLMSMLFGLYEPDEGEIYVRGEKVKFKSPNDATALGIGMVHQHFKLIPPFTVAENIILGEEPKKILDIPLVKPLKEKTGKDVVHVKTPILDIKNANKKVREISLKFGLEVNPADKIENLNVSTQQRVEILKMLYRDAEILIFDEPTAVLTPQEIEYLLEIIKGLRDEGKTIILITHKLEEIKSIADRCAVLRQGRLIDVLDTAKTTTKEMANLMVGRNVLFTVEKPEARFGEVVLKAENLSAFNALKVQCVKDVSFEVRAGEIFAIAGVSGNGQTELADCIAGLMKVKSGRVILSGEDITKASVKARISKGISYIPEDRQEVGLILDQSLADNMVLKSISKPPFSKHGILSRKNIFGYADKIIQKYDVRSGQGAKTLTRSMSGGNQQKAIIGREIELQGKLMIFVQPTRGLDVGAIENIWKLIIAERDSGKAVLLISLELEEIMSLADTIGVIYNGHIDKIAPRGEMTEQEVGGYMMGVKQND